jgi:hypothetical protein
VALRDAERRRDPVADGAGGDWDGSFIDYNAGRAHGLAAVGAALKTNPLEVARRREAAGMDPRTMSRGAEAAI